ncbi:hypothetical protein [Spiroplasma endosymbiont of Nomada rufipes]
MKFLYENFLQFYLLALTSIIQQYKKTWKFFRSFYIILLNNLGSTVEYI